jgi:hypothetical protein
MIQQRGRREALSRNLRRGFLSVGYRSSGALSASDAKWFTLGASLLYPRR